MLGTMSLTTLLLTCAPAQLEACQNASTASVRVQVEVCSQLFTDPACRRAIAQQAVETDLAGAAAACSRRVCQADGGQPYCQGTRGSPANGYEAEARVIAATINLEHPGHEQAAARAITQALVRATREQSDAQQKRKNDQDARARLTVAVEVRGPTPQSVTFSSSQVSWVGTKSTSETCADFVTRALGGTRVKPGEVVVLRVQRLVSFQHVKCLMTALKASGFADADIAFRSPTSDADGPSP